MWNDQKALDGMPPCSTAPSLSATLFSTAWFCVVACARLPLTRQRFTNIHLLSISVPALRRPERAIPVLYPELFPSKMCYEQVVESLDDEENVWYEVYSFLVGPMRTALQQCTRGSVIVRMVIGVDEGYELTLFPKTPKTEPACPPSEHSQRNSAVCAIRALRCYMGTMEKRELGRSDRLTLAISHSDDHHSYFPSKCAPGNLPCEIENLEVQQTSGTKDQLTSTESLSDNLEREFNAVNMGLVETSISSIQCRLLVK